MVSSNTIKDFNKCNTMYPSGRKLYCRHRINFVERDEDYCGLDCSPIVPRTDIYNHSSIYHPINRGDLSWTSGKYARTLFIGTRSRICPIAYRSVILRKSEDVSLGYTRKVWC